MITVVGESLVDLIRGPQGTVEPHPGGSPANVAVALARLGHAPELITQLGADAHGRLVLEHLRRNGVRLGPGSLLDATPTSVAHAGLGADGQATYTFDISWRSFDPPAVLGGCVHTGSIAAFLPPGAASVDALLAAARPTATISYDPNCRPALMGDPDRARARVEALVGTSDIVKVSADDLAWLYGGTPITDVAAGWVELGATLVVVTLGGDGAWARTARSVAEADPEPIPVVDTVGAGDAFMAGLLHACAEADLLGAARRPALAAVDEPTLTGMLAFASRVAGITCGRRGANPPTLAELTR